MQNRAASPAREANESTSQSIELTGERWAFKHVMAGQRRVAVESPPRISAEKRDEGAAAKSLRRRA
jgi:hypothetical protein